MLGNMTSPVVLPTVSYQNMRHWQRWGVKLLGQCSLHCQHQGGRELAVSGRVNESELPINVVKANEPKMLTGSNQNGAWSSSELTMSSGVDVAPPAERPHLTHSVAYAERGKPVALPWWESESQDEPRGVRAGDNRTSECRLVMRWIVSVDTLRKQAD